MVDGLESENRPLSRIQDTNRRKNELNHVTNLKSDVRTTIVADDICWQDAEEGIPHGTSRRDYSDND